MSIAKKLITGAVAVYLLAGTSAYAGGVVIEPVLNISPAPVYAPAPIYAPQPIIAAPSPAYVAAPWGETYDPHHRRHNWRYWHDHHEHHDHDHDHRR